ncbi:MAG: cation transporter [Acidobacteriota bacterium]|nr:cation transporter [Acidobacteriota bacterium]
MSLASAVQAHSPALAAFGADSLVELLSAILVLASIASRLGLSERAVDRAAGLLLFALAVVVAAVSLLSLVGRRDPETSWWGIGISLAALLVMPCLAWQKRRLARELHHSALAADAVQSATCAYLAAVTLAGLALNAWLHLAWADSVAALLAVPILVTEGRRAMRGESCGCCGDCE